jgi:hypothetical protein
MTTAHDRRGTCERQETASPLPQIVLAGPDGVNPAARPDPAGDSVGVAGTGTAVIR